ncbi:MAG: DUF1559 domain-containing protein [Planctomycetes bacterium]|nr:DUF1559 domain-containing protein [Planctomycetota bacterium]
MHRRILVVVGLLLAFAVVALFLTRIQKLRLDSQIEASWNNLRQLAFFAAHHTNPTPDPNNTPNRKLKIDVTKLPTEIPAATVVLAGVPVEDRLSWAVAILPALDQRLQPTDQLLTQIKVEQPWTAEANQQAARTRLHVLLSPANTPQVQPDSPAVTCYVAISGIGADAATLALVPGMPTPPHAGAFRYDAVTPFDRIEDGLSQTLLIGETADSPGPWLQGGLSTTRGLQDAKGVKPLLGADGQFGGYFPNGANFALCDGSVRTFTPQTTPEVLLKMATIAGGKTEVIWGD